MSDDSNIQVTFGAQIQGLLDGMGSAQKAVLEATEGMTSDIAKMAETFTSMGVAAVALAGVGLAFEGIKSAIEYVNESVEKTQELASSFRMMENATGATNEEMNQYTGAMILAGGTTSDLTGLMQGMVRSIKAHSDVLIANGVASDKAGLESMGFGEYLNKVMDIADRMGTPIQKDEMLVAAFGRGAAGCGEKLDEMRQHMAEVADQPILTADQQAQMKLLEESESRLKKAQADRATATASMFAGLKAAQNDLETNVIETDAKMDMANHLLDEGLIHLSKTGQATGILMKDSYRQSAEGMAEALEVADKYTKSLTEMNKLEMQRATQGMTWGKDNAKGTFKDPSKDKGAATVADPRLAAAQDTYEKEKLYLDQEVADAKITEAEKTEVLMQAVKNRENAELAAYGLTAAERAKIERTAQNEILSLKVQATNQQNAAVAAANKSAQEDQREYERTQREAEKLVSDLTKESASEQMRDSKNVLASQKADLDQRVAMGEMTGKQELAARRALLDQEQKLEMDAQNAEIAQLAKAASAPGASNKEILDYRKACDEKAQLEQQFQDKKAELDRKAALLQKQQFDQVYEAMTSGANTAVAGLIKGTMSWGEATREVATSALNSMINMYTQIGLKAVQQWLYQEIYDKAAQASQLATAQATNVAAATSAAAVYAVNAAASVAAIPVTGWAMAPGVGAEAYTQGLAWAGIASAAGGWDQVPADQIAQIHKNETVLSAPYAEGIRNLIANGQTGGGGTTHNHFNFNGVTDGSFWKTNQGNILKVISDAVSNRRKS